VVLPVESAVNIMAQDILYKYLSPKKKGISTSTSRVRITIREEEIPFVVSGESYLDKILYAMALLCRMKT